MAWDVVLAMAVVVPFGGWLVVRMILDILGWAVYLFRRISNWRVRR
jgi:hypothetical protein